MIVTNVWVENVRKMIISIILFIAIILIGTLGYYFIGENYSLLDSLYMTVITMSTVGFGEVHSLDETGKIFTIIIILSSIGVLGYMVTNFTQFVLEGIFRKSFKNYKVNKKITKLRNHVIICGYGRNGKQAAKELKDHGKNLVVIDNDDSIIEKVYDEDGHLCITGDATNDDVLKHARIKEADALIATMPSDADNMFIVLSARELNSELKIISRCSYAGTEVKLRHAGADNIIMPDLIGGQKMAKLVAEPDIVEFLDYILLQSRKEVSLEEISCKNMSDEIVNKAINDIGIRDKSGANVIGLRLSDGQYVFNPPPDTKINREHQIFILGNPEQINKLRSILNSGNL